MTAPTPRSRSAAHAPAHASAHVARRVRASRSRRALSWALVGSVGAVGLMACSDDDTGAAAFCAALRDRLDTISAEVADAAGVQALVDVYEELDARTPLAIAEPWSALTDLVRTAASVAPDDPASVQLVADAAYATERSARAVAEWVATTCGFAMPAMEGIEGPVDPPPTTNKKKNKNNADRNNANKNDADKNDVDDNDAETSGNATVSSEAP